MFGKLLFALTFFSYITLLIMNLQRVTATGERLIGWGMIAFGLIMVYIVCSLLLTINIASTGGFNWISSTASSRNLAVGILWLGLVSGVAFCTMLRTGWATEPATGWVRSLMMPVYFGGAWLPLLMLVPYAILLHPGWRDSLSPLLYKLPLVAGCVLSVFFIMAPRIVISLGISIPKSESSTTEGVIQNAILGIQRDTSVNELLKYSLDEDERLRMAAAERIKSLPDWESDLIRILEKNDQYGHYDFYWVYVFLDNNTVDHPDRFIQAVNNTIPAITAEVKRVLEKSFLYTGDLTFLNIDGVCRVLDEQFKDSSSVFRPNMIKLQEALDEPPLEKPDTAKDFTDLRNTYRQAVKDWLDTH